MKRVVLTAIAVGAIGALALGQDKMAAASKKAAPAPHVITQASDIKWGDPPPVFPAGAKMAVLKGDPGKSGLYIVRIKAPDGYKVAPHWHPATENLTDPLGDADVLQQPQRRLVRRRPAMPAGAFASMPAKMHHFAWCKGETEVQVSGMGPFVLTYVNPADDPSKK